MIPAGATITSVRQSPYITPGGNATGQQTTYTFTVYEHGPFSVTLRGADDTPDKVEQAIRARVTALNALGITG